MDYEIVDLFINALLPWWVIISTKQKKGVEEKGKEKDSTINENNLKYKYKHRQTWNQMCLSTTFRITLKSQLLSLNIGVNLEVTQIKIEIEVQAA